MTFSLRFRFGIVSNIVRHHVSLSQKVQIGQHSARTLSFIIAALCIVLGGMFIPLLAPAQDGYNINNHIVIHGGVNTPVGNFASLPSTLEDLIPEQGKTPLGSANLGFTIGLTDIVRLTPNLGLIFSLDGNYNPYNTREAERQLKAGISNLSVGGVNLGLASAFLQTNVQFQAQPYLNGTLMGGLRYELPIFAGVLSAFAAAQGGLFYGILPSTEAKVDLSIPLTSIQAIATVTQAAAEAAALGYGIGAGIVLFDRVSLSARYTAALPEFSTEFKPDVKVSGVQGTVNIPGIGQVNLQTLLDTALRAVPQTPSRFAFPINTVQVTLGIIL